MQENTDRAGVCRSSEVTAPVIKDAAMCAIFPGSVSCLPSVESGLIHDLEVGGAASVRRVLMHVSVNFIFIWPTEWDLECSSINTLFSAEKLMAAARLGAAERGSKSAVTLGVTG